MAFLDAEVTKAEEAELVLKASLSSFLDDPAPQWERSGLLSRSRNPKSKAHRPTIFAIPFCSRPLNSIAWNPTQEEFAQSMEARMSAHLRSDCPEGHQPAHNRLSETGAMLEGPVAFESLQNGAVARGVSPEDSYPLGMSMVDRLMGGNGTVTTTDQEMSEIEKVLLEQTVQLLPSRNGAATGRRSRD